MTNSEIRQILNQDIPSYLTKAYDGMINEIEQDYQNFQTTEGNKPPFSFLLSQIDKYISQYNHLKQDLHRREHTYYASANQREELIDYCKALNNGVLDPSDKKALNRWLDFEALTEKSQALQGALENRLHFCLKQIRFVQPSDSKIFTILLQIGEKYPGDNRVNEVALDSIVHYLKQNLRPEADFLPQVIDIATNHEVPDIWTMSRYMDILAILSPEHFIKQFKVILQKPYPEDRIEKTDLTFLKCQILQSLKYVEDENKIDFALINQIFKEDKSPFVRQHWARYLSLPNDSMSSWGCLDNILASENDESVRGAALISITEITKKTTKYQDFHDLVSKLIEASGDLFLAKLILKLAIDLLNNCTTESETKGLAEILSKLTLKLASPPSNIAVKKVVFAANLEIWVLSDFKRARIKNRLENFISSLEIGMTTQIMDDEINLLPLNELGKILTVIAKNDFDIQFWQKNSSYYLIRGVKMRFRLWRFIYEFLRPSPDKRQEFSHTLGRVYIGKNLALSNIAELSETQIPGEPIFINEEQGPRNFLPPTDYCLSSIQKGEEFNLFSVEGVTKITPETGFLTRLVNSIKLSLKFNQVAKLRNVKSGNTIPQDNYVKKLHNYGLRLTFEEHKGVSSASETNNYFKSLAIMPFLGDVSFIDYLLYLHENSLGSLVFYILIILLFWCGNHIYSWSNHQKIRKRLHLVVGGWGTRGKTSTERLKASIFNAIGLPLVSKTTGCEASMVISSPYGRMHEILLFRPYNQTTILEQRNVSAFATRYKSGVLLWECMALQKSYVNILQSEWMEDDISTITNAHADHEDIQGPTGIDVATSISGFIKQNGEVLTSEEQMLPILKEMARKQQATLTSIDWMDPKLISQDILELFPYYEHPNNIALVLKFAHKLGIPPLVALKEMICRVLPDIGALKSFQPCQVNNRKLELINGMSANEELGAVGNWYRLGLNKITCETHPSTFVSAIINNRKDRARRSRVFSKIISTEVIADRYFLIGTNLEGFEKYVIQDFKIYLSDLIFKLKASNNPVELFTKEMQRLKICVSENAKNIRINYLKEQGISGDDNSHYIDEITQSYNDFIRLREAIQSGRIVEHDIETTISKIYLSRIIIVPEHFDSPDEIVQKILDHTPRGFSNRMIGMQNIKSPGIDFVRAWQQWEECFLACRDIESGDDKKIEQGLAILDEQEHFTLLSREQVRQTILNLPKMNIFDQLSGALTRVHKTLENSSNSEATKKRKPHLIMYLISLVTVILNGLKNKHEIEQIYEDLAHNRISISSAQNKLREYHNYTNV
jgi:poly-gamma-glutamate synthase PgsB/CapB